MICTPNITLNNGLKMPVLGLGTYLATDNQGERAVKDAIDVGYRHFDTAYFYANEKEVGHACREKITEGIVKREDLFIVTKLWNSFHDPKYVEKAFQLSLENLGLEYIDLYLMHSPMGYKFNGFHDYSLPKDIEGNLIFDETDYLDTWLAMEKLLSTGKVKSIGVSNFNAEQIKRICEKGSVKPVTNQVECHPKLNQKELIEYCKKYNIVITAYRPFEKFNNDGGTNTDKPLLLNEVIIAIGKKYNKTAGQVILKYLVQVLGVVPIPKSSNKERIKQNIDIFDFALSNNDINYLDGLNNNFRTCPFSLCTKHKYFPFNAEF